jgi:hypothetical protein
MDYPLGARVRFKTSGSEIGGGHSNKETLYWSGIITGAPLCDDDGTILAVPVYCVRARGEPITVVVAISNIVAVKAQA